MLMPLPSVGRVSMPGSVDRPLSSLPVIIVRARGREQVWCAWGFLQGSDQGVSLERGGTSSADNALAALYDRGKRPHRSWTSPLSGSDPNHATAVLYRTSRFQEQLQNPCRCPALRQRPVRCCQGSLAGLPQGPI